ncbi:MAG TPA: glycosyl hydrolase family 28 protein [Clostridia bacterium]|jgi:polygalacturonase|nr:glycosyl hydrolase family 28 protein [Clostridia bacterium]
MEKPAKKRCKKIIGLIILVVILLCFVIGILDFYLPISSSSSKGSLVASTYHLDEDGQFLADIPFDKYLHDGAAIEGTVFDIRTYGASENKGFKDNAVAIQNAINAAFENGGGVVLVEDGRYRTSKLRLKSNVTLRIEKDASLECITYDENKSLNEEKRLDSLGFISASDAENVVIEGPGRIAGNGTTYVNKAKEESLFLPLDTFNLKRYVIEHRKRIMMGKDDEFKRPILIGMKNCKNITIKNLELYEAGSWTTRLEGVDNLLIEDVVINNNIRVANTDGFDIEGGSNIKIKHCFIATGDDAICIKADDDKIPPLNGLIVEDCEIMSLANCFKIGTGTHNTISNVLVKDCFFFKPSIAGGYAGIAIESVDGSTVSDITVQNITMENITSPFLIWLGYRNGEGSLKNILISDINAIGCDMPSSITGYKKGSKINYVENVKLKNIFVTYREAKEKLNIYKNSAGAYQGKLNMAGYPEITRVSHMYIINHNISGYFDLPVYGLFARYVDGLEVDNYKVTPRSTNTRDFCNVEKEEDRISLKNVSWK